MTQLSPEQWRVLNYLYQHKLHTVRPKMLHVRNTQKVTDTDLLDLIARDLIGAVLIDCDNPLLRLPRPLFKFVQLKLTGVGLHTVLGDPGNQIRYTLGQHEQPISLAKLFDGNSIELVDVASQQQRGRITITLADFGEFALMENALYFQHNMLTFKLGYVLKVALTAKGREYLPH